MTRGLFVLLLACAGAVRADTWQIGVPARLWQIGRPITHAAKYSLMDRVTFAPIIFQHPSSHEHLEETS